MYFAKDFIETAEGLIFAVVGQQIEQGRVLCFLRYVQDGSCWKKYSTKKANASLKASHPQYLFYSSAKDVHLHAVPVEKIFRYLNDPSNWPEFWPSLVEVTNLQLLPNGGYSTS